MVTQNTASSYRILNCQVFKDDDDIEGIAFPSISAVSYKAKSGEDGLPARPGEHAVAAPRGGQHHRDRHGE